MTRPVLILRPEPGNSRTVAEARAMGLDARSVPLFRVEPVAWQAPDPARYKALLLTSANALRHAGPALARYHKMLVLAVGPETAQAARHAGFEEIITGTGNAAQLLVGQRSPLLHLCGADVTPVKTPVKIDRIITYASVAHVPDGLAALVQTPAIALLHSARAATLFATQVPNRSIIAVAALSAGVAEAAGTGWESLAIADKPRNEDLLAVAAHLAGF